MRLMEKKALSRITCKAAYVLKKVGIDYKRSFELSGDRLTLSLTPTVNGEKRNRSLIWERVK
jgi:hypothetical protein